MPKLTLCLNPSCKGKNSFIPEPHWKLFCSPKCRDHYHYLKKQEKRKAGPPATRSANVAGDEETKAA